MVRRAEILNYGGKAQKNACTEKNLWYYQKTFWWKLSRKKNCDFFFLLIFFVKMKKISKLCWQNQLDKCPREIMLSIEHFSNWCENWFNNISLAKMYQGIWLLRGTLRLDVCIHNGFISNSTQIIVKNKRIDMAYFTTLWLNSLFWSK